MLVSGRADMLLNNFSFVYLLSIPRTKWSVFHCGSVKLIRMNFTHVTLVTFKENNLPHSHLTWWLLCDTTCRIRLAPKQTSTSPREYVVCRQHLILVSPSQLRRHERHPKTVAGQIVGASSFAVESSDLRILGGEEAKMDKQVHSELGSKTF